VGYWHFCEIWAVWKVRYSLKLEMGVTQASQKEIGTTDRRRSVSKIVPRYWFRHHQAKLSSRCGAETGQKQRRCSITSSMQFHWLKALRWILFLFQIRRTLVSAFNHNFHCIHDLLNCVVPYKSLIFFGKWQNIIQGKKEFPYSRLSYCQYRSFSFSWARFDWLIFTTFLIRMSSTYSIVIGLPFVSSSFSEAWTYFYEYLFVWEKWNHCWKPVLLYQFCASIKLCRTQVSIEQALPKEAQRYIGYPSTVQFLIASKLPLLQ